GGRCRIRPAGRAMAEVADRVRPFLRPDDGGRYGPGRRGHAGGEAAVTFPWLTTLVAIPAIGALLTALVPKGRSVLAKQVALGVSLIVLVLGLVYCGQPLFGYDLGAASESYDWI